MPRKTVLLIATLDTKGSEARYLRDELRRRGFEVLVLDCGLRGKPAVVQPDFPRTLVCSKAGTTYKRLQLLGRSESEEIMARGVARLVADLHREGTMDGVLAVGGYDGTLLATAGMRELPVGFPKVMLSAMACGNIRFGTYVGTKDITIIPSVFDVVGVNSLTQKVYDNAVGAICGMLASESRHTADDAPLVALTMFGQTTPCGTHGKTLLEELGYRVVAFHPNGVGGSALEEMTEQGVFSAVWDLTTQELSDQVVFKGPPARAGYLSDRLNANTPRVISPGCVDFIWGSPDQKDRFKGRKTFQFNREVMLGKLFPREIREVARVLADWSNRLSETSRAVIALPLKGLSMFDKEGEELFDPELDQILFQRLKKALNPGIEVVEVDAHINDPAFAERSVEIMLDVMRDDRSVRRKHRHG